MEHSVYAIATMDTKGHELAFVAERLREAGLDVVTVDVGTLAEPVVAPDIRRDSVAQVHLDRRSDRGQAIAAMSRGLERWLLAEHEAGKVAGVIGLGGSGGTALITPALRALPVGLPKLMVSTVASGNTAPMSAAPISP